MDLLFGKEGEDMIKISDLRARDVINILDGKKLGNIIDIDLDLDNGRVLGLVLPGRSRGFIFSKREELTVPWNKIIRIGRDVILVEVPVVNELDAYRQDHLDGDDLY
jgi:YlmC/YmxH family sporulation protein